MLRMSGVKKSFGEREILKGIDLEVNNGEIVGLLGRNGAGKTTMIKCINQLYQYEGSIRVKELHYDEDANAYLRNLGILLEPSYYDYMSAIDNLKAYANLCGVKFDDVEREIEDLLEILGLGNAMDRKVREFSFGMKQKLGVAMALVKKPDVLVLDEPSIGVDPKGLDALFGLMKDLAHKDGLSVIFSSNNLQEVQDISDRIAFLKDGKITQVLQADEVMNQDNAYTIYVKQPIGEDVHRLILPFADYEPNSRELKVENNEKLNLTLKVLMNQGSPILDIHRESLFLKDFYE